MMKSRLTIVAGALLALFLIVDIARHLARTGPRCDDCGGVLIVVGRGSAQEQPHTYYHCEACSRYLALPDLTHRTHAVR